MLLGEFFLNDLCVERRDTAVKALSTDLLAPILMVIAPGLKSNRCRQRFKQEHRQH
ncbi:hypothetical protein CY34DRAFT_809472 [Suillus luteus UH-Slu-Lm8-n1]|uniref:Uncharacterized protein n=1 Tax=Suillus luteus UH-Slu-Lm8-n1 TaxID=930992 RepID=A0A0C9ZLG8_9AGAM|nr:hypothetical protein CY34DRAFT_809472 [Suillus luteus UH-Slu-Lm8-n1]